jgi:CBS domain-containing protein
MKVSDVMTSEVEVVHPDATLREAAEKMKALDVGPLPVCDGQRLLGVVTDRDITVRATAEGKDPNTTPVRDVMTASVVYCYADQDISEASSLMQKEQIRRIVVLDRAKNLVGVVSLGDLATSGASRKLTGRALEGVSEPEHGGGAGRLVGLITLVLLVGAVALAVLGGGDVGDGGGEGTAP